ncbi:MAG: FadD3 family acyl-CoA ligase [Porticoccaceae bacterium]|jgi:HIP---CoA ligase|nr:FadD3 family acyl-CoA ligase [Alphaproteobacteria bacterium]MDP4746069.1 FadD3 family acyl-CoA ligase [Porticoccaceae bacterium]MDP4751816.1 FadD3 family acyl-CoA ligase [Porticoccaceae bacterium]MDP4889138.1 FadD3 family acyl-CoA ligase [Porticoccaceae bacterium]MDP4988035.1 FadD3 family acyl-CoA ligase [Porticoccaceae bacterium]
MSTTTPAALASAIDKFNDKVFIEDGDLRLSFSETQRLCHEGAATLIGRGFSLGDRAAIWAPNIAEWVLAALAIHCAGGVVVPINSRFKSVEATDILNASGVKWLFSIGTFLNTDYPSQLDRSQLERLEGIVVLQGSSTAHHCSWADWLAEGRAQLASAPQLVAERSAMVAGDHCSDIIFTSGTTGKAKGVITTHAQNLGTFTTWSDLVGLDESDRYLIVNPFFHSFGYKAGILACLIKGCTLLPQKVFDVDEVLARISRDKVTMLPGPPTLYQSLLAHPQLAQHDLSSLTKATTGAAVIPTELIDNIRHRLGITTVLTAYGLSESCGLATMCRHGDASSTIASTSGRAIPGIEVACLHSDGSHCAVDEMGEIVIRGFNVMQGYLDNPEATAEAIDSDGWLHTGDIGSLDAEGNLKITDRLKDMYISGGFNCYPAEIESSLNRHPAIVMSAVIGIDNALMGEVGAAFIQLLDSTPENRVTQDQLHQWCRANMANYKVPKHFVFVDSLPLNATGKIHKPTLRDSWAQRQSSSI